MRFMKKRISSVDGFVPRRPHDEIGGLHDAKNKSAFSEEPIKELHSAGNDKIYELGKENKNKSLGRSDIDESLQGIDSFEPPAKKLSRKERRLLKKQNKKPKSLVRRIIKWSILSIVLLLVGFGSYAAYRFVVAGNNIFQGSIFGILQSQPLKQDANGRSNFLILGTSEDDPGHEGADLTDSMMVVSVDQTKKDVFMFSVPRDLYVQYGMACNSGYQGKINEFFSCSNDGTTPADEQDRLAKTQKLVGDIFGLDIQYGAHINQTVIKQAVDAVGGIDVDVEGSNGAPGVLDRNADWRCDYTCYYVKYDNGVHHLDGVHALYLSMARGDEAPTYGLSRSNFDREVNQQKILVALKDKALSTGMITNLSAITQLIDALGNNLRTNVKTEEIQTIIKVASGIKTGDIHSISLIGEGDSVVTTGTYGDASVVLPSAGAFEYGAIQTFIQKNIANYTIFNEAAPIVVLNGSGQEGLGQREADKLANDGFNISSVSNAPEGTYAKVTIYQIGDGNDATAKKLAEIFGVTIDKTTPPVPVNGNVRFVIIFGPTGA